MNTADRNIALVDHALRRRFLIVEMLPDETQINNYHDRKPNNTDGIRKLCIDAFEQLRMHSTKMELKNMIQT